MVPQSTLSAILVSTITAVDADEEEDMQLTNEDIARRNKCGSVMRRRPSFFNCNKIVRR